jgi:hypothetical protein
MQRAKHRARGDPGRQRASTRQLGAVVKEGLAAAVGLSVVQKSVPVVTKCTARGFPGPILELIRAAAIEVF